MHSPLLLQHRRLLLIDAVSIDAAQQQSPVRKIIYAHPDSFTCIDTTRDFNQNKWLGQELKNTLIFFDDHTRVNALLAVLGCIKAPFFIILAANLSRIHSYFKRHILLPQLQKIADSQLPQRLTSATALSIVSRETPPAEQPSEVDNENLQAQLQLQRQLKQAGIVHLIGERGSGKSTLLGDFIAKLYLQPATASLSICLCSPSAAASANTLQTLNRRIAPIKINVSRETFQFCPPEKLLAALHSAELIIIDEAATLAKSLIQQVQQHVTEQKKKLILSTTIEGYEGSGQSYRLNYLSPANNANKAPACFIYLKTPKRFAPDDKIYQLGQQLSKPRKTRLYLPSKQVADGIFCLSTTQLRDYRWTTACFALLRDAHYKTTPNDLARFYDEPAWFMLNIQAGHLVAAIYAISEALPDDLPISAITRGTRRTKNAFTHQALIHAYGDIDKITNTASKFHVKPFAQSQILRISRVATDARYRRQGYATQLLTQLKSRAAAQGFDYLSTSFSASAPTTAFWLAQDFSPARIGLYANKYNHEYALLMLYALTSDSQAKQQLFSAYCARQLRYFSHDYNAAFFHSLLAAARQATPPPPGEKQLCLALENTTQYHLDIHWVLPLLADFVAEHRQQHPQLQSQLAALLTHKKRPRSQQQTDKAILVAVAQYLSRHQQH
ncbi:MAG: hypothetical protein CR975_06300 [Gammaproteobacteria bacterium]|nr:MAG: hypothetical protein CR975_06300 [Gammaproteobacteria bacterium]